MATTGTGACRITSCAIIASCTYPLSVNIITGKFFFFTASHG